MNQQYINILNSTNKCLLISTYQNNIKVSVTNYKYKNNELVFSFNNFNETLANIKNNSLVKIYITVCDNDYLYYLIIDAKCIISSSCFDTPLPCNNSSKYLLSASILDISCYYEKK